MRRGGIKKSGTVNSRYPRPIPRVGKVFLNFFLQVEACSATDPDKWLSKLIGAGWLQAVQDALSCAATIAQALDREGENTGQFCMNACVFFFIAGKLAFLFIESFFRRFGCGLDFFY